MKIKWQKIKDFLYKYRWAFVVLAAVFVFFIFVGQGNAADPVSWVWTKIKSGASSIAQGVGAAMISVVATILYYVFLTPIYWLIAVVIWVLVEVASFQQFINIPAVVTGWVVIRDLVNMGFVVYLLYLAFTTILGVASVNLEKGIVKLVIAVVLVNFSRMIVGLFIDLSQVIMLTFVNGFRNLAGGNVINKLGLNYFFNERMGVTTNLEAAGQYFIRVSLGITMGLLLLAIITMMVAYLIIRVVKLWLLAMLSPFMALSSLTNVLSSFTNEWSRQFREALMGGPFMAFSLWFSMMVISSTGDKSALTTPSGTMADSLGGEKVGETTNQLFTMIIGAVLLYASFDMAKKMAGEAAAVGDMVWKKGKSTVIGGMAAIGKTTSKTLGKGVQLGSSYWFGRDLSATGIKEWGKEKLADIKTSAYDTERRILEKGRLKREQRKITERTEGDDYIEVAERKLGLEENKKLLSGEISALEEKQSVYDTNIVSAKKKNKEFIRDLEVKKGSEGSLTELLTEMDAAGEGMINVPADINNLVAAGILDKADVDVLQRNIMAMPDGEAKNQSLDARDNVREKIEKAKAFVETAPDVKAVLASGDEGQISTLLDQYAQDMNLEEGEKEALLEEYTGRAKERGLELEAKKEVRADVDKNIKRDEAELKQMVQNTLLKDKKSAGHRVVLQRTQESKKKVRSHLEKKYSEIDNPDEIASFLRDGVTQEEMNYLLEKAGDDVSEVLDKAGYEKDLGGLKALYAKAIIGDTEAVRALQHGEATDDQDAEVTRILNEKLGKSTWDTMDIIDRKNRKENASLSYGVTMDPYGVHGFKEKTKHYDTVLGAYKRGKITAKALTPFLTRKGEDGVEHLTDLGKAFLFTHNREIGKDAFSDEFGKGVLDAIRNDIDDVQELFQSMQGSHITGSMDPSSYDKDKPQSNLLYHYWQTVERAASGIKGSEREEVLNKVKMLEKNKKEQAGE